MAKPTVRKEKEVCPTCHGQLFISVEYEKRPGMQPVAIIKPCSDCKGGKELSISLDRAQEARGRWAEADSERAKEKLAEARKTLGF